MPPLAGRKGSALPSIVRRSLVLWTFQPTRKGFALVCPMEHIPRKGVGTTVFDKVFAWLREELASGPFMVVIRWNDGTVEELFRMTDQDSVAEAAEELLGYVPIGGKGTLDSVR